MKKTTKAVFFSTLVFPGTGHMVLGRWWRGLLFTLPVLIALWIYIKNSIQQASIVMDKVLSGEVSPEPLAIAKMLHESPDQQGFLILTVSVYAILLLWVLAAIDAFYLARKSNSTEK